MAILADSKQKMAGSHWYKLDGSPCHSVARKDGSGNRNTTIADARKLKLVPSVTNILGVVAKPGLDKWKLAQVALAAFNSPPDGKESPDYYKDRIIEAAFEQVTAAADLGSGIHDSLEAILDGRPVDEEMRVYVEPCMTWKLEHGLTFEEREVVLVNSEVGYAGRCDVLAKGRKGQLVVLDYKTRKSEAGKPMTPYDGQGAQLAAYAVAKWGVENLHKVTGANVFISTTEPGRVEVFKHADLTHEWDFFEACCVIWRKMRGYDPRGKGVV